MPDIALIKRNIGRMIEQNAPETDIDAYVQSEGVTSEALRAAPAQSAPVVPTTGKMRQLLTGFENQGIAAGQGTTPDIAAQRPNLLGAATIDEGGNLLYKDPSGKLVPTDQNKHVALTDPATGQMGVFARTEDTDEGRLSSAGRILMTGMGAGAPTRRPSLPAAPANIQPRASDIFSTAKPYYRAFTDEASKVTIPKPATVTSPSGAEVTSGLGDRIRTALDKKFIPEQAGEVYAATKLLDKGDLTLDQLQNVKQIIGNGFASPDKRIRDASAIASKELMKIMAETAPTAAKNLKTADEIHSTALALQDLQRKGGVAGLRAGRAGYGGNAVNSMRQVLSPVVEASIKGRQTLYKPQEIAAMREIVEGTSGTDAARMVGQLSPSKGAIQTVGSIGATAALGPGALAIPAIGAASNQLARVMTAKQIVQLKDLVARRSPAYAEAIQKAVYRYQRAQVELVTKPSHARLAAYVSASRALSSGLTRDGVSVSSSDLIRGIQGPVRGAADEEQPESPGIFNQ